MRQFGGSGSIAHTSYTGTGGAYTYAGAYRFRFWGADFGGDLQFNNVFRLQDYTVNPNALNIGTDNQGFQPKFSFFRHVNDGTNDSGEAFWNWNFTLAELQAGFRYAIAYDPANTANVPLLYINGVNRGAPDGAVQQPTAVVTNWSVTPDLTIGRNAGIDLHNPAVWTRALSATELAEVSGGITPAAYPTGLVFHAPYDNDAVELTGGGTGTITDNGNWAATNFSQFGAPSTTAVVTVDQSTPQQNWYGFRGTLDAFESDCAIVVDGTSPTGRRYDIPPTVHNSMATTLAQAGLHHIRMDIHAQRSQEGGIFGGTGPGDAGFTAGPYVSSGYQVATEATDAKIDAWIRFRDAVIAAGGDPKLTIQCVFWNADGIHDDPPGDPGQNAVDFLRSFLDRARSLYGVVPDVVGWVNEADNNFISTFVTPAQLARSFDKLITSVDAIPGQPYAATKWSYTEVTGIEDDFGNPVAAFTPNDYLAALQTQNASLLSRISLGFHPYPDGNKATGLATIPASLATYGVQDALQGEFWYNQEPPSAADNNEVLDDIYAQITTAQASLSEMHTVGAFPRGPTAVATEQPEARDYGYLDTGSVGYGWGSNITAYVAGQREPVVRLYVRYLQWGARRVSESVTGSVRATSWFDAAGRTVVMVEETAGNAVDLEIAGLGTLANWDTVEVDTGAGPVAVTDLTAIPLAANQLAAVILTPVFLDLTAADTSTTTATAAATLAANLSASRSAATSATASLSRALPLSAVASASSIASVTLGAALSAVVTESAQTTSAAALTRTLGAAVAAVSSAVGGVVGFTLAVPFAATQASTSTASATLSRTLGVSSALTSATVSSVAGLTEASPFSAAGVASTASTAALSLALSLPAASHAASTAQSAAASLGMSVAPAFASQATAQVAGLTESSTTPAVAVSVTSSSVALNLSASLSLVGAAFTTSGAVLTGATFRPEPAEVSADVGFALAVASRVDL